MRRFFSASFYLAVGLTSWRAYYRQQKELLWCSDSLLRYNETVRAYPLQASVPTYDMIPARATQFDSRVSQLEVVPVR